MGKKPKEAAIVSMEEVSSAVIATSLVLMAVFIPVAFIPGITGKMFQQFAVTIAVSVGISIIILRFLSSFNNNHIFTLGGFFIIQALSLSKGCPDNLLMQLCKLTAKCNPAVYHISRR